MALISTLVDAFNTGSLNGALWTQFTGGSATVSYSALGAQTNFPATTSSSTDGDISSIATYDMTSSSIFAQILGVSGSGATHTDCQFATRIDSSNYLRWVYEAGTIFAQWSLAGSTTTEFSVAYNAATHKYWKIGESAGTITWSTSADGVTFTSRATTGDPISVSALTVLIAGTCFGADTSPTPFKWNNLNTLGGTVANTGLFFPFMGRPF